MGPETAPGLRVPDGSPDLGTQDLDSARFYLFTICTIDLETKYILNACLYLSYIYIYKEKYNR